VTSFHASHENPNDHQAVFAEYAASDNWIAVHLGQFAAGLVSMTAQPPPQSLTPNSMPGRIRATVQTSTRPDDLAGRVPDTARPQPDPG